MSEDEVRYSHLEYQFVFGAGFMIVMALAAYFERQPIVFGSTIIAVETPAWRAVATSLDPLFTACVIHGFFLTVSQDGYCLQ